MLIRLLWDQSNMLQCYRYICLQKYTVHNLFVIIQYEELYLKNEIYVLHHPTSKHQCTRFGSVPNLNS